MNKFKNIIKLCWSKETCYPALKNIWEINLPEVGQCTVTSLLYQDYFGGEIYKVMVGNISHYFNVLDDIIIDLTVNQFLERNISYADKVLKNRIDILENQNTKLRYELLKEKYEHECAKILK